MITITQGRMDLLSQIAYPTLNEAIKVLESVEHIVGKIFSIVTVDELNIIEFDNGMFAVNVEYHTVNNNRSALLPYFYKIVSLFLAGDITINMGFTNELNEIQDEQTMMIDFYNTTFLN